MKGTFELLKRTYPVSQIERYCDGYDYIINNSSWIERKKWGINKRNLQRIIKKGEKYMYIVGKENGVFKYLSVSFSNYEIIRKHFFGFDD